MIRKFFVYVRKKKKDKTVLCNYHDLENMDY